MGNWKFYWGIFFYWEVDFARSNFNYSTLLRYLNQDFVDIEHQLIQKVWAWGRFGAIAFLVGKMEYFKYKRGDPKPKEYSNHSYYFSMGHFKLSA